MAGCLLLRLLLALALAAPQAGASAFLPAAEAARVLGRGRRAGAYLLEELLQGHLERECLEEVCAYEEAREVFEDDARTDAFWQQYRGGAPCASQPCRNNGSCRDHIRGYSCACPAGFEGPDCAFATGACHPRRPDGCAHFCRPGPRAPVCSCAPGHRLGPDRRSCEPRDRCACGAPGPPSGGRGRRAFPWQVKLASAAGEDFCSGVLLRADFVLTTAGCALRHPSVRVKTGLHRPGREPPATAVRSVHVHLRHHPDSGDNDLALLRLAQPVRCPDAGLPICLPERDFAERVLIPGTGGLLSGWTLNGSQLGPAPTQLPVTRLDDEACGRALNATVTTRSYCEGGAGAGTRHWAGGGLVAREHRGTWFLTGLLSAAPPRESAPATVLLTRVPRFSLWVRQVTQQAREGGVATVGQDGRPPGQP
ncbi:vitamin K-dependent protein Z [Talpa occidentalis]|uniref:vitamin K-dependent protein Z n=1 Tax=Talpa occidentalis TaxID=50954 RepID=UPI0018905316|nr:vitamin K-dependent protein Z [Talpa occidentalis]